jgi:tight adherence protein B
VRGGWLLLAAGAAAAATLLLVPARSRSRRRATAGSRHLLAVAAGGAVAVAVTGLRGVHLALASVLVAAGWALLRLLARGRAERAANVRRRLVVDYAEALAGELRAGQPVVTAVERASASWPESAVVVTAATLDADVAAALRRLGAEPGGAALRRLAAAWELCAATGAGLAFAVEQVVETARVEQRTVSMVQGELASARATARLVATLPVVVLVAAQGMGAGSWEFLTSTSAGVGCLAAGLALALLGMWWIDRIATAAVEGAP